MRVVLPVLLVLAGAFALTATATPSPEPEPSGRFGVPDARAAALPPHVPIGRHPKFRPTAREAPRRGCSASRPDRVGAHVELFAAGRVVVVPAGIGVRGARRAGSRVVGATCSHRLRTTEPTGVVELPAGTRATLGELFDLWGAPLHRRGFAGFTGEVRAWVDGRRAPGNPRALPLHRGAQVVVAIGPRVPVHADFLHRAGL